MKSPVDLIGGFYTVDGLNWACQDTVNYLPMAAEASGTKTLTMLKTPPGLRPWVKIGDGPDHAIRGMHDVEGMLFVVAGRYLYQVRANGVAVQLGVIPGVDRVSMTHNQISGGHQVVVVNGNSGYVYNTRTQMLARITDPGYPGAFKADFIDGYIVQVEPFGRYVFHSDLADALEYNTLDQFQAESQPDRIVSLLVSNDEIRVFGSRTTQIFTNTGAAQGTFQSKGITIDRGCAGRFTPRRLDNGVFFLGDDGVIYRDNGYSPVRISTHAIEEAIAGNDWSKAFAFTWSSQGHSVYYLTFPDGQTWGYDIASQLWHRRASYNPDFEVSRRWRLSDLVYSNGQWIGGDSTSGRLFVLDWDYAMEDEGAPLVSERTSQVIYAAGNRFSVNELELLIRSGEQETGPVGYPVQPNGPQITGDAPNGALGYPYTPYGYTITAGDAAIASVTIVAGALPAGLTITPSGRIQGGPPTKLGSSTFTVRVTDANGLFADLEDTILIGAVSFATTAGTFPVLRISATGAEWDAVVNCGGTGTMTLLKSAGGNVYAFTTGTSRVSKNQGQTFENVVFNGSFDNLQPQDIAHSDGVWVVSFAGGRHIGRSTDGVTFVPVQIVSTPRNWFSVAAVGKVFLIGSTVGRVYRSTDAALTFGFDSLPATGSVVALVSSSAGFVLIGTTGGGSPQPAIYTCGLTGAGWLERTYPASAFLAKWLYAVGTQVVLVNGAETFSSEDFAITWVQGGNLSAAPSGAPQPNNITYNGFRYITGTSAAIESSIDGVSWEVAYSGDTQWNVTSAYEYSP